MASTARDLVLGAVRDYDFDKVRPFVASLKASGYAGRTVFLCWNLKAATLKELNAHGVDCVVMEPAAGHREVGVIVARHFAALQFLLRTKGAHNRVMLSDVGDVVFQADPFAYGLGGPRPGPLNVFLEHPSRSLGGCRINARWLAYRFGMRALRTLGAKRISCAGVVHGSQEGVIAYERLMCSHLQPVTLKAPGMLGYDQGVHNWLLWTGRLRGAVVHEHFGHVAHLHHAPELDMARAAATGVVRDDQGRAVPILHQYDRHEPLKTAMLGRFGAGRTSGAGKGGAA